MGLDAVLHEDDYLGNLRKAKNLQNLRMATPILAREHCFPYPLRTWNGVKCDMPTARTRVRWLIKPQPPRIQGLTTTVLNGDNESL
ncbi:hypothetical protein [Microseira sp. BLCC-F43]|jgi:hypothetical protein|uniref:hypothetical protein n=1 Tax=Microseira sp. BLCC-F43 TaxID=3153602 RepID=UPI0035B9B91F